ncbi:TPA: hypothetical protein DCX66_03950 [Candidatus Nomurabacteria bacterium]|nr:hypothetical protein [Candidatus Nomurabacteria bacterium]
MVILVVQAPVPEHPPPDQPVNVYPVLATAFRVTEAPEAYVSKQSAPQLMRESEEVTVPLPTFEMVRPKPGELTVNGVLVQLPPLLATPSLLVHITEAVWEPIDRDVEESIGIGLSI